MSAMHFDLKQDRKGMMWDLLLYVPTVTALLSFSATFYYREQTGLAQLLAFLGCFFFIAGAVRILKTRLMLLPSAPVAIDIDRENVTMLLRNGTRVDLVKNVRFYRDHAGRSFGLSGLDGSGRQLQYVFHKGQFPGEQDYQAAQNAFGKR